MKRKHLSVALTATSAAAILAVAAPGEGALICFGKRATIVGSVRRESITGTSGSDVIVGTSNSEYIFGRGGNDFICAGDNAPEDEDFVYGGGGRDRIDGEGGRDVIEGGRGNDLLLGDGGGDFIGGGSGRDVLRGGLGRDCLDPGEERIRRGAGAVTTSSPDARTTIGSTAGPAVIRRVTPPRGATTRTTSWRTSQRGAP